MKKIITAALTAAMLINPLTVRADNPGTLTKDINFDGIINAVDASMVLAEYARTSAGEEPTFTRTQRYIADTDYDGQVTAVDASKILKTYSLESSGTTVPIKTVIFGITADGFPLNFQSLTVEGAEQYIDSVKGDYPEKTTFRIMADTTVYSGENVTKVMYEVKE